MNPALPIPILLYHSVSDDPPAAIAGFAVRPAVFARHLDAVQASGRTSMTVAGLVAALRPGGPALPERPVVVTFDDGWADFTCAAAALLERGLAATLYVTTGLLSGVGAGACVVGEAGCGLSAGELRDLAGAGVEMGAHSLTHPELDAVPLERARREIRGSKRLLEDLLGREVATFAYPHGYSTPAVRDEVRRAGYLAACGVRNALSSATDDRFRLARLTVTAGTTAERVWAWLDGGGAPVTPPGDRLRTRAWRRYRIGRARLATVAGARS